MTLRDKQADFCKPHFAWLSFQWCFRPGGEAGSHSWGVQEKWKQCGRPCVTEPRSERKCCSVTCVDGAVGFQSVSTRWHQVTEACKTFCLYPDCGGHCMVLIRVVEVSEVCLGFNFVSLFSDSTKSFESWSSLFLFLDLMRWKVFLCSSIRWLQRGKYSSNIQSSWKCKFSEETHLPWGYLKVLGPEGVFWLCRSLWEAISAYSPFHCVRTLLW